MFDVDCADERELYGEEIVAIIKCRECSNPLSNKAKRCPTCGAPVKLRSPFEQGIGCTTLLVIGGLLVWWIITRPAAPPETAEDRRRRYCDNSIGAAVAYDESHRFVRERLRAPSTATFPSMIGGGDVSATRQYGCVFEVKAYVDAQNAFGGTVRNSYSMGLEYSPEKDTWTASDIRIVGR